MKTRTHRIAAAGILVASIVSFSAAHAQLGDFLKQGADAGNGAGGIAGTLGNLGGAGGAASAGSLLTPGSTGNVAGLLQFCIKNNYLGDGGASSVKDALMSKLGGGVTSDSAYSSGANGILDAGNGRTLDLSGGQSFKQQLTKQVCDKVLSQAKSLL
ncbi:hypothetical protein BTM_1110 [Burkholderia thailandensis 34]|uniref:DUF2501 domain-containing protein n=1 Tax=Burkholderia thailandensis TaxID=57975 RepID=UPI0005D9BC5E|nr:DUF2501 domain-containing protein [Burkholderia thailandensis]AJY28498.1 hypothetical protein BTM_1110 [Burkholderia thailandensis 34]AOJ55882.1 hypothetical protein AQ477_04700 [Burkholderia thailandensis]KXF60112.1 hypothetical protein AQ476_01615 [Burkholderia thailandensis]PNE75832.1 DUF2501 domain-containing protein [Burkholderia thailandensis]